MGNSSCCSGVCIYINWMKLLVLLSTKDNSTRQEFTELINLFLCFTVRNSLALNNWSEGSVLLGMKFTVDGKGDVHYVINIIPIVWPVN